MCALRQALEAYRRATANTTYPEDHPIWAAEALARQALASISSLEEGAVSEEAKLRGEITSRDAAWAELHKEMVEAVAAAEEAQKALREIECSNWATVAHLRGIARSALVPDEDEGITQLADDPRVQEALRYLEARNFVLVNRQSDDPTPVRQLIAGRLSAPATQAEREAVEQLIVRHLQYIANPSAFAKPLADAILSLLESRRTPPDPHPLTALLTRWDNGESVGDLITQYLRGEGDWGPVRVLVGATTRSPSTLPDGWRGRVKTALREHHRRVYNEYGAFWFDGELDQMADAIGEVFATGDRPNPDSPTPSEKKP